MPDSSTNTQSQNSRSWLEKLSHTISCKPQDRTQLIKLLRDAQNRQLLDAGALGMIEGVLQVSDMHVRDIMIPRSQMVVVEQQQKPEEFLPNIIKSGHSRFPVVGDNKAEVIGILLAKELLNYIINPEKFKLHDALRPAVFIPESKRLDQLLNEFRCNRYHMAIVVDEYGSVAGLVTIEDVLEQIVGEIEDEYDTEEDPFIRKYSETEFIIKAITPIEDFNQYFSSNFDDQNYDTIGGLALQQFGHMPKRGEKIQLNDFQFNVLNADSRRIHLLKLKTQLKDNQNKAS